MVYYMIKIVVLTLLLNIFIYFYLNKYKDNKQPIYDLGPSWHQKKGQTPTKGGIIFITPLLISLFLMAIYFHSIIYLLIFLAILFSFLLGLKDDNDKIKYHDNQKGLSPKKKLLVQFLIGLMFVIFYLLNTSQYNFFIISLILLFPFVLTGFSNATNFTDGLDGLCTSISIIVFSTLGIIAYQQGNLLIIPIIVLLIGLLMFLLINKNPAKMFMGDTGSLAIGVFFAICIYQLNIVILGIFLGLTYIIEIVSVVLQVSFFKYTKNKYGEGRRLFKMAPLHHHFEKMNFSENKIVILFSIFQLMISFIVLYFGGYLM